MTSYGGIPTPLHIPLEVFYYNNDYKTYLFNYN